MLNERAEGAIKLLPLITYSHYVKTMRRTYEALV
jgi:hypothetical protein